MCMQLVDFAGCRSCCRGGAKGDHLAQQKCAHGTSEGICEIAAMLTDPHYDEWMGKLHQDGTCAPQGNNCFTPNLPGDTFWAIVAVFLTGCFHRIPALIVVGAAI